MSSAEASPFTGGERAVLLDTARRSIRQGLLEGSALEVEADDYPAQLLEPRATFVTLKSRGALRGCTGSLEARDPLVVDVARNAWRSAFRDPRFPPLALLEYDTLAVSISVLTPPTPFDVASEQELLAALRPGVDGLVLREGDASATFLPGVWETLPSPRDFVAALKQKAGLSREHWSASLRFDRYRVDEVSERA